MGKKKSWFRAVKKVFSPESKKSKELDLEWSKQSDPCSSEIWQSVVSDVVPPPVPHPEEGKLAEVELEGKLVEVELEKGKLVEVELEQGKHVYSVEIASAAAAQVVQLTSSTKFAGKSREEVAAIKIQTAFRGYLARRALRALRGLVRLKSLIHGNAVKRQATTTLRCMQTLARVQSQIRSRRIRILEENQSLQRELLLKRERELENLKMSEEWDDSTQSKDQIEAGLLSKQEATIRRERALAYAFSHQWKNPSKSANPMFMDPNNPQWGWSWLERWMAARPWESRGTTTDKEFNADSASIKSSNGGEILKSYARRDTSLNGTVAATSQKSTRPSRRQSPGTPRSKILSGTYKIKSASPKGVWVPSDDDISSMISRTSERPRRHSIAGSSIRDDESLASSAAIPSYMTPTQSARAKNRSPSPLSDVIKIETTPPDKGSTGAAKKKLSFPNSPSGMRRHSGPPRVDVSMALKDVVVSPQHKGANAESI